MDLLCGIRAMRFRPIMTLILLVSPVLMAVQYEGDDAIEFTAYVAQDKVNIH